MKLRKRARWAAGATVAAAAATALGLTLSGAGDGAAVAAATGQNYDVPCPAADLVTPALNANLIENPGAEDYTAVTALGVTSSDPQDVANCWTSSSPMDAPGAVLESIATTVPGQSGAREFYGGYDYDSPQKSIVGITTTATQLINASTLNAGGQPFELSGEVGGYTSQSDYATVTATFEDANGAALGSAAIGPVTPAQRGSVTSLIPQAWYGTVPAGTAQVLVTIASTGVSSGYGIDGRADDLNLTIGSSAAPTGPVLQTIPYTATGTDGGLDRPAGVSATNGAVYASNTDDGVVSVLKSGDTSAIAGLLESYGEHGDGLNAGSATLYQPSGTAEDAKGDVYIADSGDNVVREITPDGVIHRFAGTGVAGSRLVPGQAAFSQLDRPEAVAVTPEGDVLIADAYNNRVLAVTPQGKIAVVAGKGIPGYKGDNGPATAAELSQPTGVATDTKGDIYIADASNNVIRRVDARTGRITTVAGDYDADKANDGLGGFSGDGGPATSARLNDPQGVAVDGAGDLFIADTFNNAIREVAPDGTISTVVNAAGVNGAIPPAGGESSGKPPAASRLYDPYAVAVDASTGTLYIADTHNNAIAEVLGVAKS